MVGLVLVPWTVGPTFGVSLGFSVLLIAFVWLVSHPALSGPVLRMARAVLAAIGIAAVLVIMQTPPRPMPGTPHPIVNCDLFPWAIECWLYR